MSINFAGNKRVISAVEKFINDNTIPHALLIEGDGGTGRETLARHIAAAAVCSDNSAPCGSCRNCKLTAGGNHPDIIFVSPEADKKNISVGQVRDIRGDAFVKSHMGGKKVIIINPAERMNDQAQNALLKVLEEPPKNVIFILITENASMMLSTVISRCVLLSLTVPEFEESTAYLKSTTDFDDGNILDALKSARGNIGRALQILDSRDNKNNGAADFAELLITGGSAYELLKITVPLEKNRVKCGEFITDLKAQISERIHARVKQNLAVDTLIRYYDIISDAQPQLVTNINLSLFLSALVCRLCNIERK